jgi:hypothetical protein
VLPLPLLLLLRRRRRRLRPNGRIFGGTPRALSRHKRFGGSGAGSGVDSCAEAEGNVRGVRGTRDTQWGDGQGQGGGR